MREVECCYCGEGGDESRMDRIASLLALALERFLRRETRDSQNEAPAPVDFSRDTSDYYEGMPAWGGERP